MIFLHYLQPLVSVLSAVLLALLANIVLRIPPLNALRDRIDPLLGLPAGLTSWCQAKLNRPERDRATREGRGRFSLLLVAALGIVLGITSAIVVKLQPMAEPILWFLCLRVTAPWTAAHDVLQAWKKDNANLTTTSAILQRRRIAFAPLSDRHAAVRSVVEATALSLYRGYLTPVLWGIAAALCHQPAIFAGMIVTTLVEAERVTVTPASVDTPFAHPFQIIEAIVNFIPARITSLLVVLAALFTPGAHPASAFRAMFVQSEKHSIVNAGWPVAAFAGALRIALPGRDRTHWIDSKGATARADDGDLKRGIFLHAVTLGLTVLIFTALIFMALAS